MYNVDTTRIEQQLTQLKTCVDVLAELPPLSASETGIVEQFAAARAFHVAIECVTDVGNALIDGFIMRDPGSYEDILEIMLDERVLPAAEATQLKRLVEKRKKLVIFYTEITVDELVQMGESVSALRAFPEQVRRYLQQELGAGV
ncbi:DUF86 domain-containing protein [Numidum massiliense]|uniref:DUF86 domain-containing protein n=1 Tax=Numidum massiliense TaxID=1522315 RepID=UPI0006D57841|nr:DUF86 domain-containing protein [Numidum massiliense]